MDSVFGLVGKGYVLLAADATAARSILVFKHDDEDKVDIMITIIISLMNKLYLDVIYFRFENLILTK